MSLFTKLIKKSVSNFLRKRKRWVISMAVLIFFLIGLNFIINHYVEKVVGTLIKEFVQEKSNGFYAIEYDEIAYVLNNGRLLANNFKFEIHPDYKGNLDLEKLDKPYIYEAFIPKLHIDIIEFWSIFFERKLKVIGIEIGSPDIRIVNLNKNKSPKKISFEAGNLYEIISGHLAELKINDFKISNGNLDFKTFQGPDYDNFNIKRVTFEVKNFQVNEESNTRVDKFFYTDDILFEIQDQLLLLKDSIHKVTFDKFYISTLKNELGFENFSLTRRDTTLTNKKTHDHYEVKVPVLRLSGIDFLSAYNNNLLTIDSIQVLGPTINIKKRSKSVRNEKNRVKLMDILMLYQDYIMIKHFNLSDAKLIFTDELQEQPKQYSIDRISAYMENIKIDTVPNSIFRYGFAFDKADLVVKDYAATLPDSMNTMKFDEFTVSSNPFEIAIKNLIIQPDPSAASSNNKNRMHAEFPYILVSDFDLYRALNKDTFQIKEVYVQNPNIIISPPSTVNTESKKLNPGGLFGLYEGLQTYSSLFILDKFNIINGKFELDPPGGATKNKIVLNEINLALENIVVDSSTNTENDLFGKAEFSLSLGNSHLGLPVGTVDFGNIEFATLDERLSINQLNFTLDSTARNQKINASLPELIVKGIDPNQILFENKIDLDSLKFQNLEIWSDVLGESFIDKKMSNNPPRQVPEITINHLIGTNSNIGAKKAGAPAYTFDGLSFNISKLTIDQSLSDNPLNQFDYDKINSISMDHYDFYLTEQQHQIRAENILWNDKISTFSMEKLSLTPYGDTNNKFDIKIPRITMSGINLKEVFKGSYYDGDEILIENPEVNLKLAAGKQKKLTNLDLGYIPLLLRNRYLGAKANAFNIYNAKINIHQKVGKDSLIVQAENLNLLTSKFEIDSTTKVTPNHFLFADEVILKGNYISAYHQSNSDFFNINHFYISTKAGDITLDGIYYGTNTKKEQSNKGNVKLTAKKLAIKELNFYEFTQNQSLDLSELRADNVQFHLTPENKDHEIIAGNLKEKAFPSDSLLGKHLTKLMENFSFLKKDQKTENESAKKEDDKLSKKEFPFDTLILKNINIDRIVVNDSRASIGNSNTEKPALVIPDIWFMAEGIKFNPISAQNPNRIFYSDHLTAKISNFNYVLPGNLLAISIDELMLDSNDSSIQAINFALTPLVSKYDFGPAKGYQAAWLEINNKSLSFEKVDFLSLINYQYFMAQTLRVSDFSINIFKDKRIPFPEWQLKPLPQTALRKIKFIFNVNKIILEDGFISYQEHAEKASATGEVFFSDLNATILNLTNDSTITSSQPYAKIGATANIFGKGAIKAEFQFDLMNAKNIHTYGIVVNPFDLTEFNRILVPSASVEISSGYNQKIIMMAKADEDYSYGEMKFYYDDLKITLLNRETETPKGIGNVLGSFFANTFIIKSNNPRNLFLRKGDIFFERDEKKAIFDYWTKTFLSGVVSSIGATNNKKKIRKMQDENLKEIQEKKATNSTF